MGLTHCVGVTISLSRGRWRLDRMVSHGGDEEQEARERESIGNVKSWIVSERERERERD